MKQTSLLIDTNILIPLEDPSEVPPQYAEVVAQANRHGIRLFVHEASRRDIERDRNPERKRVTLSKLSKFEELKDTHKPSMATLEAKYGPIKSANDEVDVELLNAVEIGAVNFLVSEDLGVHARAKNSGIAHLVLTVGDAVEWMHSTFGKVPVELPFVKDCKAHQVDFNLPIFKSLHSDYPDFAGWAKKCRADQRDCWVIESEEDYAAFAMVKEERPPPDADVDLGVEKYLKICVLKVSEHHAGFRLGELLLKKALRYAVKNGFEAVYLTAYPKHTALVQLLKSVGFMQRGVKGEELILAKTLVELPTQAEPLERQRYRYPRFEDDDSIQKYVLPINAVYHSRLFPEASQRKRPDLFEESKLDSHASSGNTIRKVYVSRAIVKDTRPGDILLFYITKNSELRHSQSITYAGVVECVYSAVDLQALLRLTAKRTAYQRNELERMIQRGAVEVVEFLAIGRFEPALSLSVAVHLGILSGAPQAMQRLPHEKYLTLKQQTHVEL